MIDREILLPAIARNVSRFRQTKHLTQEALAEQVGISRAQINRIEKGHQEPSAGILFAIADAFGVDPNSLRAVS